MSARKRRVYSNTGFMRMTKAEMTRGEQVAPAHASRNAGRPVAVPRHSSFSSRRALQIRVEMFQPRHHFLLQQRQRMVPGFGLVLVVEAEHQKRAETADLAIDGLDLLGHR